MDNQDLTQMPPLGEDQDDGELEIHGWSVFWAVLLGVGFVVHMMLLGSVTSARPGCIGGYGFSSFSWVGWRLPAWPWPHWPA